MRRRLGVLATVLGVCTLLASSASAGEPPLAFVQGETLSATCAELASEGVEIAIRNETGGKRLAKVAPVGFSDSEGTAVPIADVCGGLYVTPPSVRLEGAAEATVKLRGKAAREGAFTGSLTLSAPKGRVARRAVQIASEPIPATATPLVESQSAQRNHLDARDQEPLWIPVDLPVKELPRLPSGEEATTLGALAGSNGAIAVTYSGDRKRLTDTTSLVGLNLSDAGPGSYTGAVDLLPENEEAGKVSLSLTMTTWWPFPATLLVLGIVIGVWVQRQTGRTQPRAQLLSRIEALGDRLDQKKAKLEQAAGQGSNRKPWGEFGITDVGKLQSDLQALVIERTRGPVVKIDEEVLKDLRAKVAAVETQIDLLGEIPGHTEELESALEKRRKEQPGADELPPLGDGESGDPRLVAKATETLAGAHVQAQKLKSLVEKIDTKAAQISTLAALEAKLSEFWAAKKSLSDRDSTKTGEVDKALRMIRQLLFTATSSEDLTAAAGKFQPAAELIADLWLAPKAAAAPLPMAIRELGAAPVAAALEAPQIQIHTDGTAQIQVVAPPAVSAPPSISAVPPQAPTAALPATPEPRLSDNETERKLELAKWSQVIVILLAGLVAFSAGMQVLYVGKPWGSSCWDWLAIFVWGIGVQATVTALGTSIDAAALLRRVPGAPR